MRNIVLICFAVLLFFSTSAQSQPAEDDIRNAVTNHFSPNASVNDLAYRVFEGADSGTGRVAVEGTIVLETTVVQDTRERALFRDISEEHVLNNLYSQLGIRPVESSLLSGTDDGPGLWVPIVESGRTTGFTGNLYYEEKVSDIAWEIDVSSKVDSGVPASAIPEGDLVRGSDEYNQMIEKERRVRQNMISFREAFIDFARRAITGNTFDKINGCDSEVNYSLMIDDDIVNVDRFDLTEVVRQRGVHDFPFARVTLEAEAEEPRETVSYINSWMTNGSATIRFDIELFLSLRARREIGTWEIRIMRDILVQEGSDWLPVSLNDFRGVWVEEENFAGFRVGAPIATCTHNSFRRH